MVVVTHVHVTHVCLGVIRRARPSQSNSIGAGQGESSAAKPTIAALLFNPSIMRSPPGLRLSVGCCDRYENLRTILCTDQASLLRVGAPLCLVYLFFVV